MARSELQQQGSEHKQRISSHFMSDLQHELGEFLVAKKRRLPVLSDLTGLRLGCDL